MSWRWLKHGWLLASALLFSSDCLGDEPSNTLNWRVDNERGVYGYIIYRADEGTGPFRRITADIIKTSDAMAPAGRYRYVDDDVLAGVTYRYVVYSVGVNGAKQRLSPIATKTTQTPRPAANQGSIDPNSR